MMDYKELLIVVVGVIIFTLIIATSYNKRVEYYVTNGYCEEIVMGHSGTVMQKCK